MSITDNDWVLHELEQKLLSASRGLWWQAHPKEIRCLLFSSPRQISMGFLCSGHPESLHPLFFLVPVIGKGQFSVHSLEHQHHLLSYTYINTHMTFLLNRKQKIKAIMESWVLTKSLLLKTAKELNECLGREPHTGLRWLLLRRQHQCSFILSSVSTSPAKDFYHARPYVHTAKDCWLPLYSCGWYTREDRNTREIHACPRLLWSENSFRICIKFHLIPPISVVSLFLPATKVLSTVPLTSQPFCDVSKCLHGHGIR